MSNNGDAWKVSPIRYKNRHDRLSNSTKAINRLTVRRGGIKL